MRTDPLPAVSGAGVRGNGSASLWELNCQVHGRVHYAPTPLQPAHRYGGLPRRPDIDRDRRLMKHIEVERQEENGEMAVPSIVQLDTGNTVQATGGTAAVGEEHIAPLCSCRILN